MSKTPGLEIGCQQAGGDKNLHSNVCVCVCEVVCVSSVMYVCIFVCSLYFTKVNGKTSVPNRRWGRGIIIIKFIVVDRVDWKSSAASVFNKSPAASASRLD